MVLMWAGIIILSVIAVDRVSAVIDVRRGREVPERSIDARGPAEEPASELSAVGDPEILVRGYDEGDCVTWPQVDGRVESEVVSCDDEHLIEMIAKAEVDASADAPFPMEADWAEIVSQLCRPMVVDYLDGRFDPYGRLVPGAVRPLEDLWSSGHRTIWCGVQRRPEPAAGSELIPAMTGRAADLDQAWLPEPQTCLLVSDHYEAVPCTDSHHVVVVGHLDLTGVDERPSDLDLRERCNAAFLPEGDIGRDELVHLGFEPESWAAGTRRGGCVRGTWSEASGDLPELRPGTSG